MKAGEEKTTKKFRGLKIGLGVVLGLWLLVTVVLQIVLSTNFLTKMANKYAAEYVDGNVSFGAISASMFRSFPNLEVSVDDFTLTYPHDRFAAYDTTGIANYLRNAGRGSSVDTLASFRNLSVSLNYVSVLRGKFRIPSATLDGARIFAHQYDSTTANWDMFIIPESDDTSSVALPPVILKKVGLTGNPYVAFTSPKDTLFASMTMVQTIFDGRMDISDPWKSKIGFSIDSLDVEGRLPADTLSFMLNRFSIDEKKEVYDIMGNADARLATKTFGRIVIPIDMGMKMSFPERDLNSISVRDLHADIATLDITGMGDVSRETDSTYVRAELSINECPVEETVSLFASKVFPEALKLKTDAKVTLTALCDGWYVPAKKALPELIAELIIPKTSLSYQGYPYKGSIVADVDAMTDRYGKLAVVVEDFTADLAGVKLSANGTAEDVFCGDPLVELDATANIDLGTIDDFLPEGFSAEGKIDAGLSGYILLSDMSLYNFSRADLEGYLRSEGFSVTDKPDSIYAFFDKTDIKLGKAGKDAVLGADLLGFKGTVDSLYATLGESMFFRGRGFTMTAQNSANALSKEYGKEIHPIVGSIGADHITMTGDDSLYVGISGTSNSFKYSNRKDEGKTLPLLSLNSRNSGISLRQGVNRAGANDASFSISAVMQGARKQGQRKHFLDSLQKVYPGVPKDSLISKMVRQRRAPAYMEDDFRSSDMDFQLSESLAKYLREWSMNGKLDIAEGSVITPYFPLKNTIENARGSFGDNKINLSNITVRSGESDLSMNGTVSGIRRALTAKGILTIDMNVTSDRINTDEMMAAYTAGSQYIKSSEAIALNKTISDEQYMAEVVSADLPVDNTDYSLIVIPANIDMTLQLEGHEIDYSQLIIDWFASDIKMKGRTLQITNTVATSNMGDIYLEGFYSTRTKKDITAGFDLNMVDITADKVITLFPAVDSIIPLLKSFKGDLDCEMAATTQMDTNMNFIPSTINGILKIKGSDLSVEDNGGLRKLTSLLMFKDKRIGHIDDMSVQGLITDNTLEVFPFVMGVDRYTLAMNGTQNFDQSFRYHVSVLKSPLPFRFGINLSGDFDNWKYKIGKAKYKNINVPVFTTEIHDMQMNLVSSIHDIFSRGAELVHRNTAHDAANMGSTVAAVDTGEEDDEDLDEDEMAEYEQMLSEEENEESEQEND